MIGQTADVSPRLQARIAGFIYVTIIALGAVGYATHSTLTVMNDAAATAANIIASEQLWRLSIAAMLVMIAGDAAVAVIFFVLLKPVNRTLSLIGCAFRLVLVAIVGVAVLGRYAPLLLLKTPASAAFGTDQMQALSLLSIKLFERGFEIALVFFGIHCLVVGWLILGSRFLPRILGALLSIAGLLYLIDSFRILIFPTIASPFNTMPICFLFELALALWLLVTGVNAGKWREQAGLALNP